MAQPRIIVIGAGIIGASIAWHLAREGAQVTIAAPATAPQASAGSFAWINASWGNPAPYVAFRRRSMAEWHLMAAEVPGLSLRATGSLTYDLPAAELAAYRDGHSALGYALRTVTADEIRRIEPNLAAIPEMALHALEEGAADPLPAIRALLDDALRRGARRLFEPVTGLVASGGRLTGIRTGTAEIAADHVVLAAGIDCPALLKSLDITLPLDCPPGLIVHSRPVQPLINGLVIAPDLHLRQTGEGRLIAGSDFGGSAPGEDPAETARALFDTVRAAIRGGERLDMEDFTLGLRPTPVDGLPMIGPVPGLEGLSLAVMHSGITNAPATGLFLAREILTGETEPLLADYRPARLMAG